MSESQESGMAKTQNENGCGLSVTQKLNQKQWAESHPGYWT
jgi:hypothetical protein